MNEPLTSLRLGDGAGLRRLILGRVVDDVKGARFAGGPARVVRRCDGGEAVAGIGIEGDAVERANVRKSVEETHVAIFVGSWRRGNERVCGDFDPGIVDVASVLNFNVQVFFPTTVDERVGDTVSAEFGGEVGACSIEREEIVRGSDTVDSGECDEENGGERKLLVDSLLVVTHEVDKCQGDDREEVTIGQPLCAGDWNHRERISEEEWR